MVGVGQGEILKVAGIDPAAQGGCWRHRRNKPGGLNRPYSHVTSSSRLAWVGEVGKGPEHGTDFENGGVRGAPRALLSELDTSHTVVEERGGSCNTWERAPREGCEPRGAVEGGCTAEGMGWPRQGFLCKRRQISLRQISIQTGKFSTNNFSFLSQITGPTGSLFLLLGHAHSEMDGGRTGAPT